MLKPRTLLTLLAAIAMLVSFAGVAEAVTIVEYDVSPTATHFPQNKQNESPMAVNPTDELNAITGANDEIEEPDCTPATGGSSSCPFATNVNTTGIYWTTNGGASWSQQILHWNSSGLVSNGDTVIAFGPKPNGSGGFDYTNGARAYAGSLAAAVNTSCVTSCLLAVAHSDNKGATWGAPVLATTRTNPVDFNDKPAIWADANPASPFFGNVYASWTLFTGNPTGNFGVANVFSPEPIVLSRSTDGGHTWSKPVKITAAFNTFPVGGRQGSEIRTDPDGNVFVFWDGSINLQSAVMGAKSTDGGKSFGKPFLVSLKSDNPSPLPGASFRDNSFPMADISADGKIFVTWTDYTAGSTDGHGVVKLAWSTNEGASWNKKTVADVTSRSPFYPAVATSGSGSSTNVFVGFNALDDVAFGTAPGAGVVSYDAYFVLSTDNGATFGAPTKISSASSDPDAATTNSLRAQFIGDYNGATAGPDGKFWFSWTDTRNGATCSAIDSWRASGFTTTKPNIYDSCPSDFGNSDIFVAKITP